MSSAMHEACRGLGCDDCRDSKNCCRCGVKLSQEERLFAENNYCTRCKERGRDDVTHQD